MNRVTLIGNLTADAEIRQLPTGGKVANLRLATNDSWIDKASGERRTRADFHRIVTYAEGLIVSVLEPYAKKGKQVAVEGSIRTRKYTDPSGVERWITEVIIGPRGQFQLLGGGGKAAAESVPDESEIGAGDVGSAGSSAALGADVPW